MDFQFDSTQRMFQDAVRDVVDRHIQPILQRTSPDTPLARDDMREIFQHFGALGLTSARTPEAEGGSGIGHLLLGAAMELLPAFLGVSALGQDATVRRITLERDHAVTDKYLADLVAGNRIAGTAASEPNVGSDPRAIETRAVRDGDSYVLNGTKLWTSNGTIADILVVVVSLGRDDAGRNLITTILVDREESPFTAREVPAIGLRRGHLSEVTFEDCRVPAENLLGKPGDAHKPLTSTWLGNRPSIGLIAVGLAQRALDASVSYAKQRQQFHRPIGSLQLVQEMLANMATSIDAARLLCYRAMSLLDNGVWASRESSMAKSFATEMAVTATSQAIQVHGSAGLTSWLPVEEYFRDARMLPLPDGTTQINQLIIGRELTGLRAFS